MDIPRFVDYRSEVPHGNVKTKKEMKKITSTLALLLMFITAIGQNAEMADQFRANGKIYVVVGVIVLIFIVLFSYLIYMDFRLRRIEKEVDEK